MKHWLTFGGRPISDFSVYISGAGTFGAPERDRKSVVIPGRDGELTIDNGRYKNIKVSYPAFIAKDYSQNVAALRNYLLSFTGYARLEDTYHPDEFRMARYTGAFDGGSTKGMNAGSFKIEFDCMPQRWLKSGEKVLDGFFAIDGGSTAAPLQNPTPMIAKPLIKVSLNAAEYADITLSDISMRVTNTRTMYIDCDMQEAYDALDQSSMNEYLTLSDGEFPYFSPGDNTLVLSVESLAGSYDGRIDVEITPRWWIL